MCTVKSFFQINADECLARQLSESVEIEGGFNQFHTDVLRQIPAIQQNAFLPPLSQRRKEFDQTQARGNFFFF